MTTNFYSVIRKDGVTETVVSFTVKRQAELHAQLLSRNGTIKYMVVPSELTLFIPMEI